MRSAMIFIGVALAVLGGLALAGKLDFTRQKEVLRIGELHASVEENRAIPRWAGALGIAAGLGLLIVGLNRKG